MCTYSKIMKGQDYMEKGKKMYVTAEEAPCGYTIMAKGHANNKERRGFMSATRDGKMWRCQFYYKDWQGVSHKKNKSGFKTKAEQWERDFLQQQQRNLDCSGQAFWEYFVRKIYYIFGASKGVIQLLYECGLTWLYQTYTYCASASSNAFAFIK